MLRRHAGEWAARLSAHLGSYDDSLQTTLTVPKHPKKRLILDGGLHERGLELMNLQGEHLLNVVDALRWRWQRWRAAGNVLWRRCGSKRSTADS